MENKSKITLRHPLTHSHPHAHAGSVLCVLHSTLGEEGEINQPIPLQKITLHPCVCKWPVRPSSADSYSVINLIVFLTN